MRLRGIGEGKIACHPFSHMSAHGGSIQHAVHIQDVPVVILYYGWFQSISMFITAITLCWSTMHICQDAYVLFAFL
jgi:hypothetical protein